MSGGAPMTDREESFGPSWRVRFLLRRVRGAQQDRRSNACRQRWCPCHGGTWKWNARVRAHNLFVTMPLRRRLDRVGSSPMKLTTDKRGANPFRF